MLRSLALSLSGLTVHLQKGASAASSSFQYGHILQQLEQRDDPEMLWRIYICLADFVVQIAHRYKI